MKVLGIGFAIMIVVFSNPQPEDSQEIFTSAADTEPNRKSRLQATIWPEMYSRKHNTDYGRVKPFDQNSDLDNTVDQNTGYSRKDQNNGKKYLRQLEITKHSAHTNDTLHHNITEELKPEDFVGPKVKTWTAKELFTAIRFHPDHPLITYIREAATQILFSVFTDQNWKNVLAAVPSPSGRKNWRLDELEMYSLVPALDEEFRAALDHSHHLLVDMQTTHPEAQIQRMPVVIAALDISTWTKLAVKYGLREPNISPFLQEKLEAILEDMNARGAPDDEEMTLVTTVGVLENNPEYFELEIPPKLLQILEAEEQVFQAERPSSEVEIVDIDSPLISPFDSSQVDEQSPDDKLQPIDLLDDSENMYSPFGNRKRRRY